MIEHFIRIYITSITQYIQKETFHTMTEEQHNYFGMEGVGPKHLQYITCSSILSMHFHMTVPISISDGQYTKKNIINITFN